MAVWALGPGSWVLGPGPRLRGRPAVGSENKPLSVSLGPTSALFRGLRSGLTQRHPGSFTTWSCRPSCRTRLFRGWSRVAVGDLANQTTRVLLVHISFLSTFKPQKRVWIGQRWAVDE